MIKKTRYLNFFDNKKIFFLIIIYSIFGIIVVINIPTRVETVLYLIEKLPNCSDIEREMIKPNRMILQIILDSTKLILLAVMVAFAIRKRLKEKRILLLFSVLMLIIYLYFDLPIHLCYNGLPETYWELGRHFH